jgi:ribosomal protein S14
MPASQTSEPRSRAAGTSSFATVEKARVKTFKACQRCKHQRCVCTTVPVSRHALREILNDYLRLVGNDPDRRVRIREAQRVLRELGMAQEVIPNEKV